MNAFGVLTDSLDFCMLQLPVGSLNQDTSGGKIESLDKLMVTCFDHLESCNLHGRLDQVWDQMIPHFDILCFSSCPYESSLLICFKWYGLGV